MKPFRVKLHKSRNILTRHSLVNSAPDGFGCAATVRRWCTRNAIWANAATESCVGTVNRPPPVDQPDEIRRDESRYPLPMTARRVRIGGLSADVTVSSCRTSGCGSGLSACINAARTFWAVKPYRYQAEYGRTDG